MEAHLPIIRSRIWYPDGSIILQAESTQFRVHQGVLSENSVVFHDMFSIPVVTLDDVVDGCPVVQLSDTAQDVMHFLTMLYHARRAIPESVPLEVVSAMLRMGRKYQIEHIWQEALSRLEYEFPSDHATYSTMADGWTKIDHLESVGQVHNLVREIGLMRMLPTLLFCMMQEELHINPTQSFTFDNPANELTFVRGSQAINAHYITQTIDDLTMVPNPQCHLTICEDWVHAELLKFMQKIGEFPSNVSRGFCLHFSTEDLEIHLCRSCAQTLQAARKASVLQMWKQLPGFYGLPCWEQLRNEA